MRCPPAPKALITMNILNPFESSDRSSNNSHGFLQSPIDWIGEMKADSTAKQSGGMKLPLIGELSVPPLPGFGSEFPGLFGSSVSEKTGSDSGIPGIGKLPLPGLNMELPKLPIPGQPRLPVPELPKLPVPELPKPPVPELPRMPVPGMNMELPQPPVPGMNTESMGLPFPDLAGLGDRAMMPGADFGLPNLNNLINDTAGGGIPDLPGLQLFDGMSTAGGLRSGFGRSVSTGNNLRSNYSENDIWSPQGNNWSVGDDARSDYNEDDIWAPTEAPWSLGDQNVWSDYEPFSGRTNLGGNDSAGRFPIPDSGLRTVDDAGLNRSAMTGDSTRGTAADAVASIGDADLRQVLKAIEPLLRSLEQMFAMIAQQFAAMNNGAAGGGAGEGSNSGGSSRGSSRGNNSDRWTGGNTWGDSAGAGSDNRDGWQYNAPARGHHCDNTSRHRNSDGSAVQPGKDGSNEQTNSASKDNEHRETSKDDIEQRRRDFEKEYNDRKAGTTTGGGAGDGGTAKPGSDKPKSPEPDNDSKDSSGIKDSGKDANSPNKRYADTGVERGRTLFRDDFNGKLGEEPNREVFDTEHIGADGKTRQRGDSIQEKGIISENNTVMDGNGHLQLFAKKEQTWDPVAKEYVPYTKGSYHTSDGMNFKLDDHPDGVVIEVRAKHPTAPGAKFNALWIMTRDWTAKQGEKPGSTVEYDAAEGGGADIAIHWPYKDANGETKVKHPGGFHPKDVDFEDGQFHTYTVAITKNPETGRGDVTQYIDGKKEYSAKKIFPSDKALHIKASMEVSPKWTGKTLTSEGGMNSDAAGIIDYVDVSELKKKGA